MKPYETQLNKYGQLHQLGEDGKFTMEYKQHELSNIPMYVCSSPWVFSDADIRAHFAKSENTNGREQSLKIGAMC